MPAPHPQVARQNYGPGVRVGGAAETAAPPPKAARTQPLPEDLLTGTLVLYPNAGGVMTRGTVKDAFAPLNQFWISDEVTGDVIRDADGEIVNFSSEQLRLIPKMVQRPSSSSGALGSGASRGTNTSPKCVRVLLMGSEEHMVRVLSEFGQPDATQRREPQQLIAVPCSCCSCSNACPPFDASSRTMCRQETCPLLELAVDGIVEPVKTLAERLRPDIKVKVRPYYLKQAADQIGKEVLNRLSDFYCLSTVSLPYGRDEIATTHGVERKYMEETRCQIDLDVSAAGVLEHPETNLEETGSRALAESCNVKLSERLWAEDFQFRLRQRLQVDQMPIKFWDGPGTKVYVILIPKDAECTKTPEGPLLFRETAGSDFAPPAAKAGLALSRPAAATAKDEPPLPEGWTKQVSKSNGKPYYFNAKKVLSQYERPTQP